MGGQGEAYRLVPPPTVWSMAHRGRRRPARAPAALTDLEPDSHNANRGTARGLQALDRSLQANGAGRSIVIDRIGRIIAGNKTVERARRLGLPLQVVQTDGHCVVAVQRTDLDLATDPRARDLAIADNRVGELDLAWDPQVLERLRAEGLDLSSWWTPEEFAALLDANAATGTRDENAVVAPGPTDIEVGDLFALGRHRVLCGDATSPSDVARLLDGHQPLLMATDPPYGVRYDPAWRHRRDPSQRSAVGRVANDDRADWTPAFQLFTGPVAYVWHAGLHAGVVADALTAAGMVLRSQIIWQKQHFALSRGFYHWRHEPCWFAVRAGARAAWHGGRAQTTVWEVANLNPLGGHRTGENAVTGHATQKPVRLFEIPILNHTTKTEALYDPFCGSGTALIAAEKTGRTCFAMDIDPRYVQVTLTRWEQFTGGRAKALGRRATPRPR